MPWIDQSKCTSCGLCVDECAAHAIMMESKETFIDMNECIRCGVCHDLCPVGAVRHDSEKIPELIEANVAWTTKNMELCASFLGSEEEKKKCLERMKKHFNKERIVAEKTLEALEKL